jgi:hypothetical protein
VARKSFVRFVMMFVISASGHDADSMVSEYSNHPRGEIWIDAGFFRRFRRRSGLPASLTKMAFMTLAV